MLHSTDWKYVVLTQIAHDIGATTTFEIGPFHDRMAALEVGVPLIGLVIDAADFAGCQNYVDDPDLLNAPIDRIEVRRFDEDGMMDPEWSWIVTGKDPVQMSGKLVR